MISIRKIGNVLLLSLILCHHPLDACQVCSRRQKTKKNEHIDPPLCLGHISRWIRSIRSTCCKKKDLNSLLGNFTPDVHITEQLQEDIELREKMRPLFFERRDRSFLVTMKNTILGIDPDKKYKNIVYERAVKEYNGQEVMILTADNKRISTLIFKRPEASVNIIYAAGYFRQQTPSKEWAAPFAALFPHYNIISFDWRGFAESEGKAREFDIQAYKDIQAVIEYVRKDNDKPIVIVGFCFGAALMLYATQQAIKEGKTTADAFVINSTPTYIKNMKTRIAKAAPNWVLRTFFSYRWPQEHILSRMVGNLFTLNPIEMIKSINLPMHFEYYIKDPMAPIEEAIENYNAAPGIKMITISNVGSHVRIHGIVPYQYKKAFNKFLHKAQLISEEEYKKSQSPQAIHSP
jgi:hypothetical protein